VDDAPLGALLVDRAAAALAAEDGAAVPDVCGAAVADPGVLGINSGGIGGVTDGQCLFVGGLILDPKRLFGKDQLSISSVRLLFGY